MKKYTTLFLFILFVGLQGHSQVLISLLFGDKLNSENIEFGLDGGINFANLEGVSSDYMTNFNLGFYFDFNINKDIRWKFNTGVIVKSTMGAEGIAVYSLNNPDLDALFVGGSVERRISSFNVPLVLKRQIKGKWYVGLGVMPGLRTKAHDIFTTDVDGSDLSYKVNIQDNITRLDFGALASLNYKLKGNLGLNVKYYYGLVNINTDASESKFYNNSIYLGVCIPIGANKAKEKTK